MKLHFNEIAFKTKYHLIKSTLLNCVLIPKLRNNPFASLFLINLDFLLPHIALFDNIIVLPLLVFETLLIYVFCIFSTLQTIRFHFIRVCIYYLKLLSIILLRLITSLIPIFLPSSNKSFFSASLL